MLKQIKIDCDFEQFTIAMEKAFGISRDHWHVFPPPSLVEPKDLQIQPIGKVSGIETHKIKISKETAL